MKILFVVAVIGMLAFLDKALSNACIYQNILFVTQLFAVINNLQ